MNLQAISLNADWYYSSLDTLEWKAVPLVKQWPQNMLASHGVIHLQRTFDLEPITDMCIRYHLYLESVPAGTEIFVNQVLIGTVDKSGSLRTDITDNVSLENNVLLLKIRQTGGIRGVRLELVPCA